MFKSNSVRVILLLLLCTCFACALFPLLWHGLHWIYGGAYSYPSGRTFRRLWQFSIMIGLITSYRWIGLQPPNQVGYDWNSNSLRNAIIGVIVVWGFLFSLTSIFYFAGIWRFHPYFNWDEMMNEMVDGLVRGVLVAGLEEYIFRGLIFPSFCRRYTWWKAAIISSVIFSSLHFLQGRNLAEYEAVISWYSGFAICGGLLKELVMRFNLFPDAAGLFLIGMILCYAFHRTGTLWYSVGLHGGWVWFVSFRTKIWLDVHELPLWFGERQIFDGVIPMAAMLVIFPVSWWLLKMQVLYKKSGMPVS